MQYRWTIKTGDVYLAGTDADVFLSLVGDNAAMKEIEISEPGDSNNWEGGETNSGLIQTEDLGEIQRGTLRHNNKWANAGWHVDWVKITNEEDNREWTATIGRFDDGGRFPPLIFSRTSDGQYDQIQRQKAIKEQADRDKLENDKKKRELDQQAKDDELAQREAEAELDRQKRQLENELKKAKNEAELAKIRAQIDAARGSTTTSPPPVVTGAFRTYELFGILNGASVPLNRVVTVDGSGRVSVMGGARVMIGESATDGFGLGGVPGRWQMYYPGRSPAEFGLDADKGVLGSDGSRGWVLAGTFLAQVFGPNWRTALYS